jgi:hypothetical protein
MGPGMGGGGFRTLLPLVYWKNKSREKKEIYQILTLKIKVSSKNILVYPKY